VSDVWHKAALVEPPRILGVRLRPFSCWHVLCLDAFDSPYMQEGEPVTGDLLLALLICLDRRRDRLRSLKLFNASPVRRWLWAVRCLLFNEQAAQVAFMQYVAEFTDSPAAWMPKGGSPSKASVPFGIVTTLAGHVSGIDLDRAWDMPIGEALCYRACVAEENGANLVGDDVDKAEAAWKEAGA